MYISLPLHPVTCTILRDFREITRLFALRLSLPCPDTPIFFRFDFISALVVARDVQLWQQGNSVTLRLRLIQDDGGVSSHESDFAVNLL